MGNKHKAQFLYKLHIAGSVDFISGLKFYSLSEKKMLERYCGKTPEGPNNKWKTHPWFVALRFSRDNTNNKLHFAGTLISNRYVVTAAEIFFRDGTEDRHRMDERMWTALPGANRVDDIGNYKSGDWTDITSIDIHPSYKGYLTDTKYTQEAG